MRLIKSSVSPENREIAFDLANKLRAGKRVFGSPAEGLKHTLSNLKEPEEDSYDSIAYNTYDFDYIDEKNKLEAGIDGEKELSQYLEKIIRLDPKLEDLIVFASLGDTTRLDNLGYIPDTDFLCVYGTKILALDAKNVKTSKKSQYQVLSDEDGKEAIYNIKKLDEPFLEVNASIPWWQEELAEYDLSYDGAVCFVNRSGATFVRDDIWQSSYIKPVHVSELVDFLHDWIDEDAAVVELNLLADIANHQIQPETSDIDLSVAKAEFGI